MKLIGTIISISSLILMTACSSSDDDTTSDNATITASNSKSLAIAATESAKQSITTSEANTNNPFASLGKSSAAKVDMKAISENIALNAFDPSTICSSGSLTSATSSNGSLITFNDCNLGEGTILDGAMNLSTVTSGSTTVITLNYVNFSFTYGGITQTVDFDATCTISDTTSSCSISSEILGIDGRTYTVSNADVSGDSSSGYNLTAEVTDPDHGIITINASNVLFDCTDGRPSTGSITFSSNDASGSVTFDSCTSYTVALDGATEIYNW